MPLVPESRRSRQDVKASISSQFWEQPVHSTQSLDGQLWSLPCEPPALNLTGSSGLSRTQQLLAAQAARVPCFPSYDGSSNGLVLDRVLAKAGGQRWWAALSGRVKAQRAYALAASTQTSRLEAARDLGNYGLCARARAQLGRRLTLNGVVEAPDARSLHQRLARRLRHQGSAAAVEAEGAGEGEGAPAPGPSPEPSVASVASGGGDGAFGGAPAAADPSLEPLRGHATLRCALPGHDLSATAGVGLPYLDSTGEAARVPLAVSLDLASHDRGDGLQYRVGLHQVTAPLSEVPPKAGVAQRWRTSLHAQGALAVEGEAYIWRGAGTSAPAAAAAAASPGSSPAASLGSSLAADSSAAAARQAGKGGGGAGEEEAGVGEPRRTRLASALEAAQAADGDVAPVERRQGGQQGVQEAQEPGPSAAGPAAAPAAAGPSGGPPAGVEQQPEGATLPAGSQAGDASRQQQQQQPLHRLEDFMRPLEQLGGQVGDVLHSMAHPRQHHSGGQEQEQGGARPAVGGDSGGGTLDAVPMPAAPPPQPLAAAIHESVALLQQVRQSVERLTGNVQDGSLQRLSQQLADSRQAPARRRPYSMLLAQPHLKLNAALGCLARMPLPALRAFSFPHASLEPGEAGGGGGAGGLHARQASSSSLLSRASYSSQLAEAWQPYLKGTALRVFASTSVSGQLGRFTRPWLDFTAASARVDVGLTSPHVVGVVPDPAALAADSAHRPDRHRAFALEGRGAWHALSVSLAQQVYGPVRARVDARFALDPTSVPASEGERSTLRGVLQTVLSVRPALLETVYGFDCVLPGTEGAARLAVWCSPKRRECMAELRLF